MIVGERKVRVHCVRVVRAHFRQQRESVLVMCHTACVVGVGGGFVVGGGDVVGGGVVIVFVAVLMNIAANSRQRQTQKNTRNCRINGTR